MDESEAILARLARIEALDHRGGSPSELLAELRALLEEAEAWSRAEGGAGARRAVEDLRLALDPRTTEAA